MSGTDDTEMMGQSASNTTRAANFSVIACTQLVYDHQIHSKRACNKEAITQIQLGMFTAIAFRSS